MLPLVTACIACLHPALCTNAAVLKMEAPSNALEVLDSVSQTMRACERTVSRDLFGEGMRAVLLCLAGHQPDVRDVTHLAGVSTGRI